MSSKRFLLLYGSQTGQAQAIAEQISADAITKGYSPQLCCLSKVNEFNIENEAVMVMVVSTTGEGEPPDTVSKFWRRLKKKTLPGNHLEHLRFALLGLGDTNYTNFCNMGKMMNMRLLQLGAKPFHETGYADDGVGLELVVEPWIEGLWPALQLVLADSSSLDHHDNSSNDQPMRTDSVSTSVRRIETDSLVQRIAGIALDQQSVSVSSKPDHTQSPPTLPLELSTPVSSTLNHTQSPPAGPLELSIPMSRTSNHTQLHIDPKTLNNTKEPAQDELKEADKGQMTDQSSEWKLLLLGKSDSSWETLEMRAPLIPPCFIRVELPKVTTAHSFPYSESVNGALAGTHHITEATLIERRQLTSRDAVKTTLELQLSWPKQQHGNEALSYEPGDAICVLCPNDLSEVSYLVERLGLASVADHVLNMTILPSTTKKSAIIPKHIPSQCSVRQFFTHCADIRAIPKKSLLSALAEHCSDGREKRRLQWLASRQGSVDYNMLILKQHTDLLDLLCAFTSCQPPLSRLIELLPRLQPRYYSTASSPLVDLNSIKLVFNIIDLPVRTSNHQSRNGLCSGWLSQLSCGSVVNIFPRLKNTFQLPSNPLTPLIMIGPGTGIAPFIGFLQHRLNQKSNSHTIGPSWLFFGCRHPEKDHIYKEELDSFVAVGVLTKLSVSFSRVDGQVGQYVQDCMRDCSAELGRWVLEDKAHVYVCGDAVNMAADVRAALSSVLEDYQKSRGGSQSGEQILTELIENGMYLVDSWT